MSMQTTVEQVDGAVPITVLALDGELDASNFQELIDTVRRLYDEGTRQLIIDLAGLRFMASSGLVALHSIVRIMHGEEPLDPEGGWGALHSIGGEPADGGPLGGPAARGRTGPHANRSRSNVRRPCGPIHGHRRGQRPCLMAPRARR